jgi:hypothetical protein
MSHGRVVEEWCRSDPIAMRELAIICMAVAVGLLSLQTAKADADSPPAYGGGIDEREFFRPFTVEEITLDNALIYAYQIKARYRL